MQGNVVTIQAISRGPGKILVPEENRAARTLPTLPLPVAIVCIGISCGMAFRAFDGLAGQSLSAIINASMLYVAFLRQPPTPLFWRNAMPVLLLVSGAILWGLFATFLASGYTFPDYALGKFLALISAICALLLGAMMARGRRRRRAILDWLLLVNAVILFTGLVFRELGVDAAVPYWTLDRLGRFTGLASNANVTAAIAACCAVITFVRLTGRQRAPAWASAHVKGYFAYLPLLTITTGVVVIAGSRFTAGVLGVILVLYLILWKTRQKLSLPRMAVVGGAVALLIIIIFFFSGLLADRYSRLGASWDDRAASWGHLWNIFLAQPVLGYGLGSFPGINAHFLTTPRYAQANWAVNSAHNIGLQMLLQGGVLYFSFIVSAWLVGALRVVRTLHQRWIRDNMLIVVLLGLLMACASVDIVLDMPAPVSLMMFLAGLLWGQTLDRRKISVEAA